MRDLGRGIHSYRMRALGPGIHSYRPGTKFAWPWVAPRDEDAPQSVYAESPCGLETSGVKESRCYARKPI